MRRPAAFAAGRLRRFTARGGVRTPPRAMTRLWDFGRLVVGNDFESLRRRLAAANAFQDDDDAIPRF